MKTLNSSVSTWRFKSDIRCLYRVFDLFPLYNFTLRSYGVTYGIILNRLVRCYKLSAGLLSL